MKRLIPGTTIKYTEQARNSAFSLISPVLEATGGLTLSQLSKLTGLEGSTIQNWIKRGWVSSTKGKKYDEQQVLRILLINMLRGTMKLESIVNLMTYINGDVEDTADDIIDEILLFDLLCKMKECDSGITSDAEKLSKAMYVMVMAYRSAWLKSEMEKGMEAIFGSGE